MKYQWLIYGTWLGCGISPLLRADVLDDAGVPLEDLIKDRRFESRTEASATGDLLLGIPLSPEHEEQARTLSGEAADLTLGYQWLTLLEARGDFEKALAIVSERDAMPLDRARLLLRLGRADEARAVFTDAKVAELGVNPYLAFQQLSAATRPLEAVEDWGTLESYLEILLERLKSPAWQATVWREQTDVAWHRDLLPAFIESAAGDKLKLAIIQQRLGNDEEVEKLLTELTQGADAKRIAGLLPLFRQSETLLQQAQKHWDQSGLAVEDRRELWLTLYAPENRGGLESFHKWLRTGGDAAPFADLIFKSWLSSYSDTPLRAACLEILHSRFPWDPRFQFLLGRQIIQADPGRATRLFESVASSSLRKDGRSDPGLLGDFHAMNALGREGLELDPALLGFYGLRHLNRQDRIKEVIGRQPEWAGLSKVDQARYLALGGMDQDFCDLVLGVDPALPENASLTAWLAPVLRERSRVRVIPPAIYERIAGKFPELVLGAPDKNVSVIQRQAKDLVSLLTSGPLEPEIVVPAVTKLREAAGKRPEIDLKALDRSIANAVDTLSEYRMFFPAAENSDPRLGREVYVARQSLQDRLQLFAPPEIDRLAPGDIARPDQDFRSDRGSMMGESSIGYLSRWSGNFPRFGNPGRKPGADPLLGTLMRVFPAGHPRRLLVDVMVFEGAMADVGEPLKAESKAAVENLLSGKLKIRGADLYRFMTLAKRNADPKELRALLEEVKLQPPAIRERFAYALTYGGENFGPALGQLMFEILGTPRGYAARQATREKPDEDVVKLQNLRRNEEQVTDEAIELSGRILEKQLSEALKREDFTGERVNRSADGVYLAVHALDKAGRWKGWKDTATARMREAGRSELDTLRFLRSLEGYASVSRNEADQTATARRIFELDPTDQPAAKTLLQAAMESRDRPLLIVCIRALGLEVFGTYDARRLYLMFQNGGYGEFLSALEGIVPNEQMRLSREVVETLHGFFLSGGPELATRYRKLLAERNLIDREMRVPVAKQLLDAGQQAEAVEWIAASYVPSQDPTGAPWAFPLIPGREDGYRSSRVRYDDPETLRKEFDFLREQKLVRPLIEFFERGTPARPVDMVTLRLADSPDAATFERHALPLLEQMKVQERSAQVQHWYQLFSGMPGGSSLALRIAAEDLQGPGGSADAFAEMIEKVANIPEGRGMIPGLWKQLEEKLAGAGDNANNAGVARVQRLLPVMLEEADDATWQSYWKWRNSKGQPAANLRSSTGALGFGPFVKPARILELLPVAFGEFDADKAKQPQWQAWLDAILRGGDAEMLRRFRMIIPDEEKDLAALCDLAEGKPDALFPVTGIRELGGGESAVWWNLATMQGQRGREVTRGIPLASFPALDGKFDVQILGAEQAEQFKVLKKIESAGTAGHVTLKLPEEVRQVALLVTERGGAVLRWTPPIDRSPGKREAASPTHEALLQKGLEQISLPGPGGLPAYRLRQSGEEAVVIAEVAWDGSSEVQASAWSTGRGNLGLNFLDAKGKTLREEVLSGQVTSSSGWQQGLFRGPGERGNIPSATERIVLSAGGRRSGEVDLGLSSLLLAKGDSPVLPEGFERLGRLAGIATMVALSPDEKKLAIITQEGRAGVMDLASREIKEFAPEVFAAGQERSQAFARVLWAGNWLFAAEGVGTLYRVDPATLKKTMVWEGDAQGYGAVDLRVSADQRWLVWMKHPKTLMLLPVDGGEARSLELAEQSQFVIAEDGVRLLSGHGKKLLLKASEFAAGQAAEVATPDPSWDRGWYQESRLPLKWEGRLRMQASTPSRSQQGDKEMVAIPASQMTSAVAKDGTLYYADTRGVIVRVAP